MDSDKRARTVYVTNIDCAMSEGQVLSWIEQICGDVTQHRLSGGNGRMTQVGFFEMSNEKGAQALLQQNYSMLGVCAIRCEPAKHAISMSTGKKWFQDGMGGTGDAFLCGVGGSFSPYGSSVEQEIGETRWEGSVREWLDDKGYGFIYTNAPLRITRKDGMPSDRIFCHKSQLPRGKMLKANEPVTFQIGTQPKGDQWAVMVEGPGLVDREPLRPGMLPVAATVDYPTAAAPMMGLDMVPEARAALAPLGMGMPPAGAGGKGMMAEPVEDPELTAKTVCITGIDTELSEDEFDVFIRQHGEVAQKRLCGDPTRPTRFGFIEFTTVQGAQNLMANGDGFQLGDTQIRCRPAKAPIGAKGKGGGKGGGKDAGGGSKGKWGHRCDWICESCKAHVFGSKDECFKCFAPRTEDCKDAPESLNWRDWICESCKAHVFGSKDVCFKCFAPRTDDCKDAPESLNWRDFAGPGGGAGHRTVHDGGDSRGDARGDAQERTPLYSEGMRSATFGSGTEYHPSMASATFGSGSGGGSGGGWGAAAGGAATAGGAAAAGGASASASLADYAAFAAQYEAAAADPNVDAATAQQYIAAAAQYRQFVAKGGAQ